MTITTILNFICIGLIILSLLTLLYFILLKARYKRTIVVKIIVWLLIFSIPIHYVYYYHTHKYFTLTDYKNELVETIMLIDYDFWINVIYGLVEIAEAIDEAEYEYDY